MSTEDVENVVDNIVEAGSQIATGGLLEYSPSTGQVKKGYTTRYIDEGVGEITGRNAYRQSLNEQRESIRKAEAAQSKLMEEERNRRFRQEVSTSNRADAIRKRADQRARQNLGMSVTDTLGA